MTMTDPIADMLTRIRNANSVHHDKVEIPCSKIKTAIAEILKNEGSHQIYLGIKMIRVLLKYGPKRHEHVISGIKFPQINASRDTASRTGFWTLLSPPARTTRLPLDLAASSLTFGRRSS